MLAKYHKMISRILPSTNVCITTYNFTLPLTDYHICLNKEPITLRCNSVLSSRACRKKHSSAALYLAKTIFAEGTRRSEVVRCPGIQSRRSRVPAFLSRSPCLAFTKAYTTFSSLPNLGHDKLGFDPPEAFIL